MTHDRRRALRLATAIAGVLMAAGALVVELRRGRRLHAGQAALKLAAAVVGAVIAVKSVEELERGAGHDH